MSVNVRKIAKFASVSPATVSRVFNDYPHVKLDVRRRVIEAALSLGYTPQNNIVWLILPGDYYFSCYQRNMLQTLYKEADQRNIHLLMVSEKDIPLLGGLYLCDGVISLPYRVGLERKWGAAEVLPMICINSQGHPGDNILRVASNNRQGVTLALEHFKSKGHKRIVFINMDSHHPQDSTDTLERQTTYIQWMQENFPDVPSEIIYYFEIDFQFRQLIDKGVTALFVPGEDATTELLRCAKHQNIRIPEDISLIGMENDHTHSIFSASITTIGQNWSLIAATVYDLLGKLIRKQPASDQFIDFEFNERSSVLQLPSGQ